MRNRPNDNCCWDTFIWNKIMDELIEPSKEK